jgi:AcrR family transcriptional regulator
LQRRQSTARSVTLASADEPDVTEKHRPGRPKGASSEDTHERIIVAARRIFAEHGYANTQNRKIAEAAEITTSTLYHYFQSKLDLYVSVFRASERELTDAYTKAAAEKGIAAQLDAIFAGSLELHARDESLLVFLAGTAREMRSHEDVARAIAKCPIHTDRILRETLEQAARAGEIPASTDVDAVVPLVFALTSGVSLYASFLGAQSYPRMIGALREMVRAKLTLA